MAERAQRLKLSESIDSRRVPEALFGEAYEEVSPNPKALLKCGIQCAFAVLGREQSFSRTQSTDASAGICRDTVARPVDWTLLLVDGECRAAARLAAAALLPRLAGVEDVAAIAIGGPPPPTCLVSLELAGIEDFFVLTDDELADYLSSLEGCGRICCLAQTAPASLAGQSVLFTDRKPSLALLTPEAFDTETLTLMHGFVPETPGKDTDWTHFDAVFANEAGCKRLISDPDCHIPLILSPGFEGFWLHPARPADFLMKKRAFLPAGL